MTAGFMLPPPQLDHWGVIEFIKVKTAKPYTK